MQTVPKVEANSIWQQELLMRMSLRNSVYRPQNDAQQTQLIFLHLFSSPSIKHKEDILGELIMCPQLRTSTWGKSQIFQKAGISFWQIVTMGGWFLFFETAEERGNPYGVSIYQKEDGRDMTRKYSLDGASVESFQAWGCFHLAKHAGYQPSQKQKLCPAT